MKITYWITTAIVALMMLFAAFSYIANPEMAIAFRDHLGIPDYLRIELAVAKALGAIALLIPVKHLLKEWVYAGFTINFVSAFIAHLASGDPVSGSIMPIVLLVVLFASYFTYHKVISKTT